MGARTVVDHAVPHCALCSRSAEAQGFTLIEVVIAVFVVAFSLVAILEIFSLDIRSSNDAREQLKASVRAQSLMEQVAASKPPRASNLPETLVTDTGLSERVTVSIGWSNRDTTGSVVIVREFF